jgi:hypothetical protein
MADYRQTALYFEDRAKRARHEDDRVRFLAVAQKYRAMAVRQEASSETAPAPKHSGEADDRQRTPPA